MLQHTQVQLREMFKDIQKIIMETMQDMVEMEITHLLLERVIKMVVVAIMAEWSLVINYA